MNFIQTVTQDLAANKGNHTSAFFVVCFRISNWFSQNKTRRIIGFPWRAFYKVLSEWIYQFELKDITRIGPGFQIWHRAHGSAIGKDVIIGKNFAIRHNTQIGGKGIIGEGRHPIVGDNVVVGLQCIILGELTIGNGAIIGAGSVVVKDVPENAIVAGNPARIIKYIELPQ